MISKDVMQYVTYGKPFGEDMESLLTLLLLDAMLVGNHFCVAFSSTDSDNKLGEVAEKHGYKVVHTIIHRPEELKPENYGGSDVKKIIPFFPIKECRISWPQEESLH